MKYCILIKNGRLFDPANGLDQVGDILTLRSKIVPYSRELAAQAADVIDAEGLLVTPGLIDFHAHFAHNMADNSVFPDLAMLPCGVTSAVDAGSTGTSGADAMIRYVAARSEMTLRALVNVSSLGVAAGGYRENPDPARFDQERMEYLFERYPEHLLGVKIRAGKTFTDGLGTAPLSAAKKIADHVGRPLCLHLTDPELPYDRYLALLTHGDILCHCFQCVGNTMLDADGTVGRAARKARERGVVFDSAFAEFNYDFTVMRAAFSENFFPDVISTDMVAACLYNKRTHSLPYVMSKHLALGMPLAETVAATTATPARLMGLEGKIGSLLPGADADIALFQLRETPILFEDGFGNRVRGERVLCPCASVKAGRIMYKRMEMDL